MTVATAFATRSLGPAPGGGAGASSRGVVEVDAELGVVVVAEAEAAQDGAAVDEGAGTVAARLAVDQLLGHLRQHADVVERFNRLPSPALRSRLQGLLREGLTQASREVHALGRRRQVAVGVSMDVALLVRDEAVVAHGGRGEVLLLHEGLVHRLTGRAELAEEPPPRDQAPPPGHDDPITVVPLLGESADPPLVQALTIGLSEGDRLVVVGAGLAEGVSARDLRRVHEQPNVEGLADAVLRVALAPADRARLLGVAQVGGAAGPALDRLSLLRSVDLFKWCTDDELLAFVGLTRPQRYREGELLLRQGSVNTTLYLLVAGTVGVNKDGQRIARTGAGSIFGEMSMLDEPRASATVEALSDVEVLTIARDAFLQALKKDATMAVKVLWSMLLRVSSNLRVTSQRLAAATAARPGEEEA
ncbi:cyclic nucleotide-binding domain-containing protein [Myxococcota bacterium]|nr:cyclic nucleotide-binding domain-containing protein [Myxococcota bacterium]